ncbi:MAG TPA: GAF domain-containing protein [Anaerolineales bacterium]|nr:GAF domain-containing protein [Anaerolineales bacterium]
MNINPPTTPRTGTETTRIVYQNWRQNFARPMLVAALGFGALALVPALLTNQGMIQNTVFVVSYLLLALVTFVNFPYWLKMGAFLLIVYGLGLNELFSTGILGDGIFFFLALIIFATMMFSVQAGAIATVLTLVTFAVMGWLVQSNAVLLLNNGAIHAQTTDWLSASATTLLFAITIILGLRQLQIEFLDSQKQTVSVLAELEKERGSLEERVEKRTLQLKAVNQVGRAAGATLDTEELIARVVNLITDQFGYYYTAIFLVDEKGEWAELQSATGEAGRVLRENKHRLRVGGGSMVGTAIATKQPRIAMDAGAEAIRFENPLLPYTRSEIALPLIAGDQVLGVLDVQSTQAGAFGPQEIETLEGMANQVATAFENARLFQESQKNLEEAQSIQRQYLANAWKSASESQELDYQVGDEEVPASSADIEVPLTLRDEIIGQINLAGEGEWTPEQKGLIEAVATQAALALENARLVEESQSSAAREHLLADITGKIWASTTMDGILQAAVRELAHAFDASEATIELKVEE